MDMAFRIHEQVVRGEIDSRIPGQVTGTIWLAGHAQPVRLELSGNPLRDLAGHVLTFSNPKPKTGSSETLEPVQKGQAGDMTASRKVKVPQCSDEELREHIRSRTSFPWAWANTLYLEWFSKENGRVVIEAPNFSLELDPEATWQMSVEDEEEQRAANEQTIAHFFDYMTLELDLPDIPEPETDISPQEREAEQWDARMEKLNDRIAARLEELDELDEESYTRIMDEERERMRIELGEPKENLFGPEEEAQYQQWVDDFNASLNDEWEEMDAEDLDEEDLFHPLVSECHELGFRIRHDVRDGNWMDPRASMEHPLKELIDGVLFAGAKLAGAFSMCEEDWPPEELVAGEVIVFLKKAREYLRDALAGLHGADQEYLGTAAWRNAVRDEVMSILDAVTTHIQ